MSLVSDLEDRGEGKMALLKDERFQVGVEVESKPAFPTRWIDAKTGKVREINPEDIYQPDWYSDVTF